MPLGAWEVGRVLGVRGEVCRALWGGGGLSCPRGRWGVGRVLGVWRGLSCPKGCGGSVVPCPRGCGGICRVLGDVGGRCRILGSVGGPSFPRGHGEVGYLQIGDGPEIFL